MIAARLVFSLIPMNIDRDRICAELHRFEWARELSEEIVGEIAGTATLREISAEEVVISLDAEIDDVYIVVAGCLQGVLVDRLGKPIHHDTFRRGSVVGLFSLLLPERSSVQVQAAEHTTVIVLGLDELLRLTAKHREFQLAMLRVSANLVKRLVMVDRNLPRPATIAVVHQSDATRGLTGKLARRVHQLGESPSVAGDDERRRSVPEIPYTLLFEKNGWIGPVRIAQKLKEWKSRGRLLLDLRADHAVSDLARIISYADVVLWCLQPQDAEDALQRLKAAEVSLPRLRDKLFLVWMLSCDAPAPPYVEALYERAARDFKICSGELRPQQGKLLTQGIERVIHYLRGVQIGLALGGGAARGMAHLGVLKCLEQHGIFVDMLAGTSAGAMTGGVYAAGLDPEYSTACFKRDLMPPWFFRLLPGSGYWYLLHKYRLREFGPMLRKYLDHLRMEQLTIPTSMMSVDLVEGVPLIRDRGDVTDNILESINLPPLSLPIVQAERAVVDGGLLNNVPADVLVSKGCNFVIASTVTSKLEQDFMGIRSKRRLGVSRFLASIQVMMRQNLILNYSKNAQGVAPADMVIAPDLTSFDLSEFTRADEMAVVGESAAAASIQQLRSMLTKLDSKLFP